MKPGDNEGFAMGLWGPTPVSLIGGKWRYTSTDVLVPSTRPVFSTESACIAGREPKKRKTRKNGRTHAEVTACECEPGDCPDKPAAGWTGTAEEWAKHGRTGWVPGDAVGP
jgi:hypothetical protein